MQGHRARRKRQHSLRAFLRQQHHALVDGQGRVVAVPHAGLAYIERRTATTVWVRPWNRGSGFVVGV